MKLKSILISAFLALTLIPTVIVLILLYKSGFELSKESYIRNLSESVNVQVDYITQTIENNMIADYRFANKNFSHYSSEYQTSDNQKNDMMEAFKFYLEMSEDKIAVCMLLDNDQNTVYTIGEKNSIDTITNQLPDLSKMDNQAIYEFNMPDGAYSLGIVTPIFDSSRSYLGSLISVYDKSYLFKIISSYYKISNASTYICRQNGEIVNFKESENSMSHVLNNIQFSDEGTIDTNIGAESVLGYYKEIYNTPWYLVGFINTNLVYSFTNQFVLAYILIIVLLLLADIMLSLYFSGKVVKPINDLIVVMDAYRKNLDVNNLEFNQKDGYFETKYLQTTFMSLMKTILLVQHNFQGVYRLYQSSEMEDTNIDIDVKSQTIHSNKESFAKLMDDLKMPDEYCIVEKFTNCFCSKDQQKLMAMFEKMRDEHLSTTQEATVYTPHFNEKWFHSMVVPMYDGNRLSRLFIQLRDISQFKKQEFESSERANRDFLTKLYNRSGFIERVSIELENAPTLSVHGLLFIDMNYFKLLNDNLGHSAGDELLCSVAQQILDASETNGIAARLGGDEFTLFMPNTTAEKVAITKELLTKGIVYPFETEKASFVVSASVGTAICEQIGPSTLEDLLNVADADMYQTKREFKSLIH